MLFLFYSLTFHRQMWTKCEQVWTSIGALWWANKWQWSVDHSIFLRDTRQKPRTKNLHNSQRLTAHFANESHCHLASQCPLTLLCWSNSCQFITHSSSSQHRLSNRRNWLLVWECRTNGCNIEPMGWLDGETYRTGVWANQSKGRLIYLLGTVTHFIK